MVERRISLPRSVAAIYEATKELNAEYPCRSFTPDGHLVGHLGEVIAAKEFGLTLLPNSHPGHDAMDSNNRCVQIKLTAGNSIAMYANCDRLIVMWIESAHCARLIYDGDGEPIWAVAGKRQKNGQRRVGLAAIRRIAEERARGLRVK
jgi:Family of unknown function (DUF6998)